MKRSTCGIIFGAMIIAVGLESAIWFACNRTTDGEKEQHEKAMMEIVKRAPDVLSAAQFSIRAYQGHTQTCALFLVQDAHGDLYQACLALMEANKEVLMVELQRI